MAVGGRTPQNGDHSGKLLAARWYCRGPRRWVIRGSSVSDRQTKDWVLVEISE